MPNLDHLEQPAILFTGNLIDVGELHLISRVDRSFVIRCDTEGRVGAVALLPLTPRVVRLSHLVRDEGAVLRALVDAVDCLR